MSESNSRIVKSFQYRENGFEYINGSKRKDRYGDLEQIKSALSGVSAEKISGEEGVTSGSDAHAKRYTFGYKNPENGAINFHPTARSSTPYPHQGHHLIPIDFRSLLTDPQVREIASKVEVNLNRGQNIIFLPERTPYTAYHNLPYHCGSHDAYNKQVLTDAKDLKDNLKKYVQDDPCASGKDLPKDIVDQFDDYSADLWDIVSSAGRKSINQVGLRKTTKKKKR